MSQIKYRIIAIIMITIQCRVLKRAHDHHEYYVILRGIEIFMRLLHENFHANFAWKFHEKFSCKFSWKFSWKIWVELDFQLILIFNGFWVELVQLIFLHENLHENFHAIFHENFHENSCKFFHDFDNMYNLSSFKLDLSYFMLIIYRDVLYISTIHIFYMICQSLNGKHIKYVIIIHQLIYFIWFVQV